MKRVVLYVADKCPHCKDAQRYLDSKKIEYRLTNAKMQRGRKELQAMGARSIPVLKIGDQIMVGWNQKNFDKMYNSKNT
ncbi:glutaredoxin family protein [Vibrio cyclitrophicus 1F53]|uniref:glutaredoxin family protein n=1 Tax=Vibrio cyclitrophicus TaxID=47951 RepID=UPI0003147494|nr:glutaredoxin family protein [Vibrio cyclitrophicus]MBY7660126.1 glutaredoxin family protein [Vibrio atlanticus]NOI32966.1 glutaredoxin family protein [Vibrio cyclitrophicus]OEF37009.1 NrdH-redoxin [Vibrio cyclitrophicus 1F53]OEF66782.1 NrdH-redoxin [Vibrio cyclitrophicus 1F175]PMH35335.1 NrdH-redoxin [Vibrio cyclitrophicus]